jgi:hypothetical protein
MEMILFLVGANIATTVWATINNARLLKHSIDITQQSVDLLIHTFDGVVKRQKEETSEQKMGRLLRKKSREVKNETTRNGKSTRS